MKIGTATKFAVVPEWVLFADVSAQAVRAYAVLARHADNNGAGATPSFSTIADEMKTSRATAVRAVTELRNIGAVSVRNRGTDAGDQTSNEYTLAIVPPAQGGSQVDQGGSQTDHGVPPVDHGVPRVSHEREVFNENPLNESETKDSSHAASLPAPETWGELRPMFDLVETIASTSPPDFAAKVRRDLLSLELWQAVDEVTRGTQVYYDTSLRAYVLWLMGCSKSKQHKNLRRGFLNWVREDVRREQWEETKRRKGLRAVR